MNISILATLRNAAKKWHSRMDQRDDIRRNLRILRLAVNNPGAFVVRGKSGLILFYERTSYLSCYGSIEDFTIARIAIGLGIPFIDITTVETNTITSTLVQDGEADLLEIEGEAV